MRKSIAMDEVPFAPLPDAPAVCDIVPPVEPPPAPAPYKRPQACVLHAWRNDGARLDSWRHETAEAATAAARALSFVIYWKYAIQCGRDTLALELIPVPDDYAPALANWETTLR